MGRPGDAKTRDGKSEERDEVSWSIEEVGEWGSRDGWCSGAVVLVGGSGKVGQ